MMRIYGDSGLRMESKLIEDGIPGEHGSGIAVTFRIPGWMCGQVSGTAEVCANRGGSMMYNNGRTHAKEER